MESELTPRLSYLRRTTCVKCLQNGHVVLNGKDVYCRTCFDDYCAHKFRSSFGKHKIFRQANERVLIAVSGGPVSAGILCDLVRRSCDAGAHKKLQIRPEILRIVEKETDDFNSATDFNFPVHLIHIGSIFDDENDFQIFSSSDSSKIPETLPGRQNLTTLIKLLDSFTNDTSRFDFYRRIKTFLFVRCARILGIRHLIVGETCTALSSRILSNTTQGRGGQTRDDVQVLDLRWSDDGVRILRPLREFQNREIAYYNHFRGFYEKIDFRYEEPDFVKPVPESISSLQSVSDDFVDDLQSRFPATVNTLFASASKLLATSTIKMGIEGKKENEGKRCRLCASAILENEDCEEKALPWLCYGCNLNLSDLDELNHLPGWLMKTC